MATGIERLTDRQVKSTKKSLNDGGNLWILKRGDSKIWAFRYTMQGKARKAGLGGYPTVTLADARKVALSYRKLIHNGVDPIDEVNRLKREIARTVPTFNQAAARYILKQRHEWRNKKHTKQWLATIRNYADPVIGTKLVTDVTKADVLKILKPIWLTKTETAKRVQGRIENILDWCYAMDYIDGVNPSRWHGNLDKLLQSPAKIKRMNNNGLERHHPAMPYDELPDFYAELSSKDGISIKALRFLILTACRSGEVLNATWDEIDIQNKTWTISAARMKAYKEHRVPLTNEMIAILESLHVLNEYVFPGQRVGRPLSGVSMNSVMKKMDVGHYVPHGFRSSFRDWCEEQSSSSYGVIERALAHTIPNKTERAYNRGDLFDKRRELMTDWGDYVKNMHEVL
jgi:integrase